MDELWQLYDEQGQPLKGQGRTKDEVFAKGLLHGAAHVWIWRNNNGRAEVLLQKRAAGKRTWPNLYDISAAGHIDLGETPLEAARREAKEEIDLDIDASDASALKLFVVHRAHLKADRDAIENEFQWLYSLELTSQTDFNIQASEVDSLKWVPLDQFIADCTGDQCVPHGKLYYDTVVAALKSSAI